MTRMGLPVSGFHGNGRRRHDRWGLELRNHANGRTERLSARRSYVKALSGVTQPILCASLGAAPSPPDAKRRRERSSPWVPMFDAAGSSTIIEMLLPRFCAKGPPMHIAEGVLPAPILAAGAAIAAAGVGWGLRRMDYDRVPRVAVLSSAFFVASLIHVPVPGSSVHLVLNGLTGIVLGGAAFPAIFIALVLQAVLFQFGGITTLGVNTCTMAIPAVICGLCFRFLAAGRNGRWAAVAGFATGAGAVCLAYILWSASLLLGGGEFRGVVAVTFPAYLALMAVEGMVTMSIVSFLRRVRPDALAAASTASPPSATE